MSFKKLKLNKNGAVFLEEIGSYMFISADGVIHIAYNPNMEALQVPLQLLVSGLIMYEEPDQFEAIRDELGDAINVGLGYL